MRKELLEKMLKRSFMGLMFLSSNLLYGDALSTSMNFLKDDSKYESLANYGVVSVGMESSSIDLLTDDVEVEQGIQKKLDIHLYGYSIYSKISSNYLDLKIVSPSWKGFSSDNPRYSYGSNKLTLHYKSLDYTGTSTGKIDSYSATISSSRKDLLRSDGAAFMDWLRFDYNTMRDDYIDNYANYYWVGLGGRMASLEDTIIKKMSRKKLSYDIDFNILENAGIYGGYGWANGENPNVLFGGGLSFSDNNEEKSSDFRDDNKGVVYSFQVNPSIFFTFPLGYLKLQYKYKYSVADVMTTNGVNGSIAIIF